LIPVTILLFLSLMTLPKREVYILSEESVCDHINKRTRSVRPQPSDSNEVFDRINPSLTGGIFLYSEFFRDNLADFLFIL